VCCGAPNIEVAATSATAANLLESFIFSFEEFVGALNLVS
jgi:hypothetical protein